MRDYRLGLESGNKHVFTDDVYKHYFSTCLLVKNRGKHRIEHLNGFSKCPAESQSQAQAESNNASNETIEGFYKGFDRQARAIYSEVVSL